MGLSAKLIGAMFQYKGDALHIIPGEQVAITIKGKQKPISQRAVTPQQVQDVLSEIGPPDVAGKTGTFEFTHQSAKGPVTVTVENLAGQIQLDIVPGAGSVASPSAPDVAPTAVGGLRGSGHTSSGQASSGQASSGQASSGQASSAQGGHAGSRLDAAASGIQRTSSPGFQSSPAAARQKKKSASKKPPATARSGVAAIERYFMTMVESGASDLHLTSHNPPLYRNDGDIEMIGETEPLMPDQVRDLLWEITPERNRKEFEETNDTDFAYEIPDVARFRCNLFMDRMGMGGVFRVIPSEILTAEDLKLSRAILDLCFLTKGLVIVTGPTGSGKSTTLAAIIDYINRKRKAHIITVEDPIEFVHETKQCLINQRQIGLHTKGFKPALRAALREDPDIVLVGEMRDLETIHIAIETAETGHLVFGTLHTNTAPSTVDRVIDQFPADEQAQIRTMLSESLRAVIAQTLCKKIGGGRIAALEVLMITPSVSNLIREGKTFQIPSMMQTGKKVGMVTLNEALVNLVTAGKVEANEAYMKAVDKPGIKNALQRHNIQVTIE